MPDGGVSESPQPARKPIEVYRDKLPLLTAQTLTPLSTFSPDLSLRQTRPFLEAALARTIMHPFALLAGCTDKATLKKYPLYQRELAELQEIEGKDPTQALSLARQFIDHPINGLSGAAVEYLMFGAFRELQKVFPNISFFRAADLTESMQGPGNYTHTGIDFAPAALAAAVSYYDRAYGGGEREYPIMAVAPFSSVVAAYQNGQMFLRTEGAWWRSALELSSHYNNPPQFTSLWRLPDEPQQRAHLLDAARQTGIKPEHLALLNGEPRLF